MNKSLKANILKIIDSSTIHGLPNVLRSQRLLSKIIWSITTLVSISVGSFFTLDSVLNYFSYEVITSIETFYEQHQVFPAVTICSLTRGFNKTNITGILADCIFNDDESCFKTPENYFEQYYDPNYQKCYRFNSGKDIHGNKTTIYTNRLPGKDYGLKLKLIESVGLIINIHNQSLLPFRNEISNNYNGNNILVSSGFVTDIIINRVFDQKLPKPYNDCYGIEELSLFNKNHTIIRYINSTDQFYSQQRCLKLCFNLYYLNENPCNCAISFDNIDELWPRCFRDKELRNITGCTSVYKKNFIKNSILEKCSEYCPLECNSISYQTSYSIAPITTPIIFNQTELNIYYREAKYTLIKQKPKIELFELISNAGGILGLFIGISFLSFIEFVEIFIEILYLLNDHDRLGKV